MIIQENSCISMKVGSFILSGFGHFFLHLWVFFFFFNFILALLRYNSHTIRFTHLMTIQWILVYSLTDNFLCPVDVFYLLEFFKQFFLCTIHIFH